MPGKKHISGILQVTRKGVGYLPYPKDEALKKEREDIEIQTAALGGALNGDMVEVELLGLFPRPKGIVKRVAERAKTEFVCTMHDDMVAIPADVKFYRPIRLSATSKKAPAGSKVLVRLLSFDGAKDPVGEVVSVIGKAGEHRTEMNAVVLEHGFDIDFPEAVKSEARDIEKNHAATIAAEAPKRVDYRNTATFTIDPADAKDFDDALSVKELPDGTYEIGIHIADATFFCRPGTALDDEAIKRGTSVYLVDATIPMLPLELSGDVCSLREGEDRLTFSAVFIMNKAGEVLSRRFEKSIIRSDKRFTYEQAQKQLDVSNEKEPYTHELLVLRDLARILKKQREKEGAIDFGDNEFKFELDKDGVPIRVVRKVRIETNSLIEEFMLLANREVAKHVSVLAAQVPESGMVFLYRIHDEPKEDRIEELATFVHAIGYEFGKTTKSKSKRGAYTTKDIAKLLKDIEGKPEEHLVRMATLRSMAKAIYSTKNIGHFGMSFDYYTHFTSPIRRYPDMLVHRILASHIDGKPITRREYVDLEKRCIAATEQEVRAVQAERDSTKYKQVEYMTKKIGQTFDCVISGVTEWGLYVEDTESGAEGLVRVRTIGNDFYNHSPKEYALIGQRTKKKFTLGDRVKAKLVAADINARTLDFELA